MEGMAEYPDNYFDLAIVDPPYGIGAGSKSFINGSSKTEKTYFRDNDWDEKAPNDDYFIQLMRVSKNQIIWGGNYFPCIWKSGGRCFIFWDKTIHGNSYADGELAWSSFDKVARYFRENISQTTSEGRIHPTQKSIKLYSWLLQNYSSPEHKILDTHLGSASHAIAWHYFQKGGEFVGFELDEEYFEKSIKRIEQETAQISLF